MWAYLWLVFALCVSCIFGLWLGWVLLLAYFVCVGYLIGFGLWCVFGLLWFVGVCCLLEVELLGGCCCVDVMIYVINLFNFTCFDSFWLWFVLCVWLLGANYNYLLVLFRDWICLLLRLALCWCLFAVMIWLNFVKRLFWVCLIVCVICRLLICG